MQNANRLNSGQFNYRKCLIPDCKKKKWVWICIVCAVTSLATCTSNVLWYMSPFFTWIGKICPDLAVHNLETPDRKKQYQYGESVVVTCKTGYKSIGQKYLTCLESGHWNDSIPRCEGNFTFFITYWFRFICRRFQHLNMLFWWYINIRLQIYPSRYFVAIYIICFFFQFACLLIFHSFWFVYRKCKLKKYKLNILIWNEWNILILLTLLVYDDIGGRNFRI